jgi:serpin B
MAMKKTTMSGLITSITLLMIIALPQSAPANDTHVRALTKAYTASGQRLFKKFAISRGNIAFSPYSIGVAMAMTLSGARGETAKEMARVLKLKLKRQEISEANAAVLATLRGYDRSAEPSLCPRVTHWNGQQCETTPGTDGQCPFLTQLEGDRCVANWVRRPPSVHLVVANALITARKNDVVAKNYITLLTDKYGAEVFEGATVNDVNDWVKQKTKGKIDQIIDELPDVSVLNAVYLKARWQSTFRKELTRDKPFTMSTSQKVSVPTMVQTRYFPVMSRPGYRAIRLPYDVNTLGMIIVLPNKIGAIDRVSDRLDARELSKVTAELNSTLAKFIELEVPRFRVTFKIDNLSALFRQAGMVRVFDRRRANFSGITGLPPSDAPFWIDAIRHRGFIEVTEDGTEAAAATDVGAKAAGVAPEQPKPEPFHVDHPFLFYIIDNTTNAVLFQGRITEPQ